MTALASPDITTGGTGKPVAYSLENPRRCDVADRFRQALSSLRYMLFASVAALSLIAEAQAVQIERVQAGDTEAWLVTDHANPLIAVRVAFRGGAAMDPPGKEGLARMAAALLDEGAGDLDSQAFQRRVQDLSIRIGFDAGLDSFGASFETLSEHRGEAFSLLRLALTKPRFDTEAVERIRSQLRASLLQQSEDPDAVAERQFWAETFPDHPYGRPVDGTMESVQQITVEDLNEFVRQRFSRERMIVAAVGDITAADLQQALADLSSELPKKTAPGSIADVIPTTVKPPVMVPMDVPQSVIVFGQAGLKRDDPRFYALMVLNQVLGGGGLTSRLFHEVREQRGLVYGISTWPAPLDHAALLVGRAGTAGATADATRALISEEWQRMSADGITAEELADAKTYLTGSFPLRFSGSGRLASLLVSVQLDHLGIDYLDLRKSLIEQVSLADANDLAKQLLRADDLLFVSVGRSEQPSR